MDINEKLKDAIQSLLIDRFGQATSKSNLKKTNYSYQFACPYCGDSSTTENKKRAHLYLDSSSFHCYNCETHKSLFNFFVDFDKLKVFSYSELDLIDETIRLNAQEYSKIKESVKLDVLFDNKLLNKVSINRNTFKEYFNLSEIPGTSAESYLKTRCHFDFSHFLYNKEKNSIYILNRTNMGKIVGYQIRVLNKSANKYYTYSISEIYKDMGLEVTDEIKQLDSISLIFNVFNVDFSRVIKVLEGPFDAYLLDNAIARLGTGKKLPFSFTNLVFINDYDQAGNNSSIDYINDGYKVFLWERFFKDHKELYLDLTKKIDITDVIKASKKRGIPLKALSDYYSKDKYDLYFL
jgi:hypothetical protein